MVITYVFSNCCKSVFYWFVVFPQESDSPSIFLYGKPAHLYLNTSNDSLLHKAASSTVRGHWLFCDLYIPSVLLTADDWCSCSSLDNSRHLYCPCSSPLNTYRNSCNTYLWRLPSSIYPSLISLSSPCFPLLLPNLLPFCSPIKSPCKKHAFRTSKRQTQVCIFFLAFWIWGFYIWTVYRFLILKDKLETAIVIQL